ncbi:hypothetical protein [Streptosporangium sp. NPDC048865]|uniref:hypothetical protein n=1 Tax=Streptosporangium sp. NPDC048865 TaxID=3155766 RepID=UPI0034151469
MTFGVGRQSVDWFCSTTSSAPYPLEGPYALVSVPGEVLFWGVLLLPVLTAGLLLRGSRRATLTAAAAVGAVLALELVAFLLPGLDPCTGQERTAALSWPLIGCCSVAAGALLLAARSPLRRRPPPPGRHEIILWAGAVGAAAWAAAFHRLPVTFGSFLTVLYTDAEASESFWNDLARWSGCADTIGLPVVLVASAAAARAVASARWERPTGTAAAAVLLLFPLLDVVEYVRWYGEDFQIPLVDSVRWHLLLAAVLVASAVWSPRRRISWAETVRLARHTVRGQSENAIPGGAKNLVVAIVIVATAVWLVASSFAPTR